MASPARIVAVNLGSQTISMAEFRRQAAIGLAIHGFRRRDVVADNPADPVRHLQITTALRQMLDELGIKKLRANYAVPGQSVFTRFVRLPAVEEEKIERIIAFEAQQNVPFPIDEVVWDYQLVGGGGDEQLEVVLVAIKSDLLEALNSAVEAAGLRPGVIDAAPMALYNAFRYNYDGGEGCSLLVDIGARTTNLVFAEQEKIFSRSVPIGGSSITSALAKEFNESFNAAEARKKEIGFAGVGGRGEEGANPEQERMAKIIGGTLIRLQAEIMRSISHYRSQQGGEAPGRVYLCGGSASIAGLRKFLAEKLQVPVEFLNPLRKVLIAPGAEDLEKSAHLLGEVVGLALRSIASCPMELNLRPPSVVRAQNVQRRRPFLLAAAACIILMLLGWSAYFERAASALQLGKRIIDGKVDTLRRAQARLDALRKDAANLDKLATPLLDAVSSRSFWPQLLEDLNARLPKEDLWITELFPLVNGKPFAPDAAQIPIDADQPGQISRARSQAGSGAVTGLFVRGLYLNNPRQQEVVVDYYRSLVRSPFFKLDPADQSRVMKPTLPNNSEWAFPYELRLDLKQPLLLQ
ncbi:MAG TPA: type IV pilus assembly protein PilM [Chthoniobacterales bacterium]